LESTNAQLLSKVKQKQVNKSVGATAGNTGEEHLDIFHGLSIEDRLELMELQNQVQLLEGIMHWQDLQSRIQSLEDTVQVEGPQHPSQTHDQCIAEQVAPKEDEKITWLKMKMMNGISMHRSRNQRRCMWPIVTEKLRVT
jgi:hypothetical protein